MKIENSAEETPENALHTLVKELEELKKQNKRLNKRLNRDDVFNVSARKRLFKTREQTGVDPSYSVSRLCNLLFL